MSWQSGACAAPDPGRRHLQVLAKVGEVRPLLAGGAKMIVDELKKENEPLPEHHVLRMFGADVIEIGRLIVELADLKPCLNRITD